MLEQYQKELDKKEVPEGEVVKPEHKQTLKEILGKKEDSDLFGEMLKREGDEELSKRIAGGQLTEDDIDNLDKHRIDFLTTMEEAKVVKESIKNDVIDAYTKHNPELQKVVGLVGLDAYRDIVREKMSRMAITEPDAFRSLFDAVKEKNEFQSSDLYKGLDDEVTKMCADRNIKPQKYIEAMAIEDESERAKALRKATKENWSNWKKAGDFLTFGTWSKRRAEFMGSKKEEIDLASEAMKMHKASIGEFLAGLSDNEQIRSAVAKNLIGEQEEKIPVQGFKESKGQMPTEKSMQDGFTAYKTKNKIKNFETMTPDQQDAHRDAFLDLEKKKIEEMNKKKSGFWSAIFSIFSTDKLDSYKDNLK